MILLMDKLLPKTDKIGLFREVRRIQVESVNRSISRSSVSQSVSLSSRTSIDQRDRENKDSFQLNLYINISPGINVQNGTVKIQIAPKPWSENQQASVRQMWDNGR